LLPDPPEPTPVLDDLAPVDCWRQNILILSSLRKIPKSRPLAAAMFTQKWGERKYCTNHNILGLVEELIQGRLRRRRLLPVVIYLLILECLFDSLLQIGGEREEENEYSSGRALMSAMQTSSSSSCARVKESEHKYCIHALFNMSYEICERLIRLLLDGKEVIIGVESSRWKLRDMNSFRLLPHRDHLQFPSRCSSRRR
jgi:hypothetical protein